MIKSIISFSIKYKLIIFLFTATVTAFGIFALSRIPVGAVPDITNNQVQVITVSTNLSTQDIEQFITYPIELEMANLPGVQEIRSVSKFGLSVVTIVFDESMGTYLPRQLIEEKIKAAKENIPEDFGMPTLGPITTGLGEIYQYTLDVKPGYEDKYDAMKLRTIQDWLVKRNLSGIPGVVEINSWGGYLKQFEVSVNPQKLFNYNISLAEVFNALENSNSIAGGAYIEKGNRSFFIRGNGLLKDIEDIKLIVVKKNSKKPILIKDIAEVKTGYANRFGAITANGEGEKVLGQIMMLKGANSQDVINAVHKKIDELQKILPEGVYINPILDRSELLAKTSFTIVENLLLGSIIVIFVVMLLLGDARSALIIASIIPLALLFTISLMYIFGIDANLMSLGALDFGIIIDGAVILVEFIMFSLILNRDKIKNTPKEERKSLYDKITAEGAGKMMSSAVFGQVIILIILVPILSLTGVEGKMFRPMALTFSFAIIGAMIFGFTWLPVASSLFLKPKKLSKRNPSVILMNIITKSYKPVLKWSYSHKKIVLGAALASLIFTGIIFTRMGGEFIPTLDEGDFVIQPVLKTGTSLSETVKMMTEMEKELMAKFSEIDQIVCRIGAAEVPTDPMSMEETDMIIRLKPKNEWVNADTKEELADKIKETLSVFPGIEYEFTQPIEMRFNELITGVRADIAVKIYGEDLDYLNKKAIEIKKLIEEVQGAADIIIEKTAGLPQIGITYKTQKIARFGMNIKEINNTLTTAFAGNIAGSVFEGEKRFDLVLRYNNYFRKNIENIKNMPLRTSDGKLIRLSEVADVFYTYGPAKISRDNTHRRVVVSINVRNRDLQSVVEDIQVEIDKNLKLKAGYYVTYGGQFENLQNATRRLFIVVPIALLLIFIFLHFAFKSIKDVLLIYTAVPLSAVGGVTFLWIRGMPFSVSAGIGFIALFGIAVLNGIVLLEHFKELKKEGKYTIRELIFKGTQDRLRAVLLTASAAALGFLPMAISSSAGAEVQRPLATVVIGGLVTSTLLTMIALPLLYAIFEEPEKLKKKMKFKKLFFFIGIFLLVPATLQAQTSKKQITLEKAVEIALKNNPEIKQSKLTVDRENALIRSAFDIEKTDIYYEFDENNIAENNHPLNIFGVEQSFKFPTIYISEKKSQKIRKEIAETKYDIKIMKVKKDISLLYYKIIYLQNSKKLILKIDSLYKDFITASELRYRTGETNSLSYLNAKAKADMLKIRKENIEKDIETTYDRIKTLLQTDFDFSFPDIDLIPPESNFVISDSNIYIKLFDKNSELKKSVIKTEKSNFLPSVTIGLFNGNNTYPGAENYIGYQAGISVPLFFGAQKSKLKAAKINLNISLEEKQIVKIKVENKISLLKAEISKLRSKIDYYENVGKKLSSEILKSAQMSYENGDIDYFKFIFSVENALNIKYEYLKNLKEYSDAVLELNYLTF
ncbi:MAG: CusA/CzcA family heavy metal efflux RND transporter [Bacteroidales bacterium]|nr:CusA/CzcA family heavy metal efflux RND transporter [Bacteroidales bacterium]